MSGISILKTKHPEELVTDLKEDNIIVSARGQDIQVSVNLFNNDADIDVLVGVGEVSGVVGGDYKR